MMEPLRLAPCVSISRLIRRRRMSLPPATCCRRSNKLIRGRKTPSKPGLDGATARVQTARVNQNFPAGLFQRGGQSLLRGGDVLGAQFSFRFALRQTVGDFAAFEPDPR